MQRKPFAKVQEAENRRKLLNLVRIQQHIALLLMRQLQDCTYEPDAPVAIDWMNLDERDFVVLTVGQQKRLPRAIAVLRFLLQNRPATYAQMRGVLDAEQYKEYKDSFDWPVSHIEDEWENRPEQLDEYLRLLKNGDLLFGLSERISARARYSVRGVKYTSTGETTAAKVWHKAEKYYESALMYLQGECESNLTAAQLQPLFDRELDFNPETGTLSADAVGVPRVRGSRSHHCLDKTRNLWGAKKSKFHRQRDAVTDAVYKMLFPNVEYEHQDHKLGSVLRRILEERDRKK